MDDRRIPAGIWHERELVDGRIEKVLAMVLRTRGCVWARKAGCLMCGYRNEALEEVSQEEILAQVENGLKELRGEEFVKIYTSGSFLDDSEISPETREKIFRRLGETCSHVLVETRPEFAMNAVGLTGIVPTLEIALGLETANDVVLARCVRKGAGVESYLGAMRELRKAKIKVRTYLLLKPPFLTEKEAIEDTLDSILAVAGYADVISINPVNVQRGTFLERMFLREEYRPPWFWSLFEVIKKAKAGVNTTIISHPSGAGKRRGIHNCRKCDDIAMDLLKKYNLTQKPEVLDLTCNCRSIWESQIEVETALRYSPYLSD
ncbi:MAG: archaeosine biosynthesis radical SAM protein RaSEA [Thermoplasmata archaeon]|nr:archaeosine biosynthesis radical SAM protein RaSEA [Thermoplasmata archaeon]